jgi:hypothetical protein
MSYDDNKEKKMLGEENLDGRKINGPNKIYFLMFFFEFFHISECAR